MNAPCEATAVTPRELLCCPECEYALRGLAGDFVTCPECGSVCDLAKLQDVAWTGSWRRAPEYIAVLRPIICLALTFTLVPFVFAFEAIAIGGRPTGMLAMFCVLVGVVAWIALSAEVLQRHGLARGGSYLLATHALAGGNAIAVIATIVGAVFALDSPNEAELVVGLTMIAMAGVVVIACYFGERRLALHLMRHPLLPGEAQRKSA